jgi:hypothetical protein
MLHQVVLYADDGRRGSVLRWTVEQLEDVTGQLGVTVVSARPVAARVGARGVEVLGEPRDRGSAVAMLRALAQPAAPRCRVVVAMTAPGVASRGSLRTLVREAVAAVRADWRRLVLVVRAPWRRRRPCPWLLVAHAARLRALLVDTLPVAARTFAYHASLEPPDARAFLERAYDNMRARDLVRDVLPAADPVLVRVP